MPADPPDNIQFAAKDALEKKEAADREQKRRVDAANAAQNRNDDGQVRGAVNPKIRVEDNAEDELKEKEEKEKKEAKDKAEKEQANQANKENGNTRNPGEQPGRSDWWEIGARIATAAGKVTKSSGDKVVKPVQELWRNRKEIWKNFKESWTKKSEANSEKNNNNNENQNGNPNPAEGDPAGRRLEGAEKQWDEQAKRNAGEPAQQGVNPILPAANAVRGGNPVVDPGAQPPVNPPNPPVNPANPNAANPNPGRRGRLR